MMLVRTGRVSPGDFTYNSSLRAYWLWHTVTPARTRTAPTIAMSVHVPSARTLPVVCDYCPAAYAGTGSSPKPREVHR